MKRKITAALLAFMLVFQVMSSGYMTPLTALATDQVVSDSTIAVDDAPVDDVAATKVVNELQQTIANLFEADNQTLKETVVLAQLETIKAKLNTEELTDEVKLEMQIKLDSAKQQLEKKQEVTSNKVEEQLDSIVNQDEKENTSEIEEKQEVTKETKVEEKSKEESTKIKSTAMKISDDSTTITPVEIKDAVVTFDKLIIKNDQRTTIKNGDTATDAIIHENDLATVNYTFNIPAGEYKDGDYFSFKLPNYMLIYTNKTSVLNGIGNSADTYWNYTVDKENNIVTIKAPKTTTNYEDDLDGEFGLEAMFGNFSSQKETTQLLKIPGSSADVLITVNPKSSGTYLTKEDAKVSFDSSDKRVADWNITVNPDGQTMKNLVLSDNLPEGMKLNGKIKVTEYSVALNGEKTKGLIQTYNSFPIDFHNTSSRYEVAYTTEFDEDSLKEKSGSVVFENTAKIKADNIKETSATGKAVVKLAVPVEKSLDDSKENTQYKMNWLVKYNFNKATLTKNDVVLTDTVTSPNNMHHIEGKVIATEVTIDKNGEYTRGEKYEISPSFKAGANNVATIDLSPYYKEGGDDKAFILEYATEVTDYSLLAKNETGEVKNTIDDSKTATAPWNAEGINYSTGILTKNVDLVNYETKEISWKITLTPPNGKTIDYAKIKDTFDTTSMTYVGDSLSVVAKADKVTDYQFTENSSEGFQLDFNKPIDSPITITYKTKMTKPGAASQNYANNLNMKWAMGG